MSRRSLRRLAWISAAATAVVWAVGLVTSALPQHVAPVEAAGWAAPYLAFAVVGTVIVHHRPEARLGWMLLGVGLVQGVGVVHVELLQQLAGRPGWLPAVRWLALTDVFGPLSKLLLVVSVMTFPDGRLPSRRWRWAVWVVFAMVGLVIADGLVGEPSAPGLPPTVLASPGVASVLDRLTSFDLFAVFLLLPASALVARFRSGNDMVQAQVKWFAVGVAALVVLTGAGGAASGLLHSDALQTVLTSAGMVALAIGICVAVVRHRLYDVDVIISRVVAYAALVILASAVYVAVVVVVGAAVHGATGSNLLLSTAATVVVALAFNPARVRLQALANQLVFGRRQTPYESLSTFTRSLTDAYDHRDVLGRMAELLAAGVGAHAAAVSLFSGDGDHITAAWPGEQRLPADAPARSLDVLHRGERLGSLSLWLDAGRDLNSAEEGLLLDLSVQAGLVLRNARVEVELERRLEELRASRRRLASAQDAERRRLERDLHDGAQHDLVSIRMKLALAEAQAAAAGGGDLADLLSDIKEASAAALENIRALARGIHPPLLESQGLTAALAAHVRRLPLPVAVRVGPGRLDRDVEATVYYCCVEALQNVVKHSAARTAWVDVHGTEAGIAFEIGDDGHGFDAQSTRRGMGLQNIADRLDALGGTVSVESGEGGTVVRGALANALWTRGTEGQRVSARVP